MEKKVKKSRKKKIPTVGTERYYRSIYESLKKDEILLSVMPDAVGNWSKDKEKFIRIQEILDKIPTSTVVKDFNLVEYLDDEEDDF